MNFTDGVFVPFILLVLAGLHFFKSHRELVWFIVAASCVFYAWWDVRFLLLLAVASVVDFHVGKAIGATSSDRNRGALLALSVAWNLGILLFFKYTNFLIDNLNFAMAALGTSLVFSRHDITLPVGISFFTFETLSYSIDVYRKKFKPISNISHFMLFISFFPHLVAGPVVRAKDFLPQVERDFREAIDETGLFYVFFGLAKKIFIADLLAALVVDPVFANPSAHSGPGLVFAAWCYSFQIFMDFSGYTDIAIGLARLLGFDLGLNFNAPYLSRGFGEFWNRWHISLSSWFRDYVYIPLGGNRVHWARHALNVFIVFFLSGLWHGSSWKFIVWGVLHGSLILGEQGVRHVLARLGRKVTAPSVPYQILKILFVFNTVSLAWIFFRAESFQSALMYLQRIAAWAPGNMDLVTASAVALLGLSVVLHATVEPFKERVANGFLRLPALAQAAAVLLLGVGLFEAGLKLLGHKAFIYFQF